MLACSPTLSHFQINFFIVLKAARMGHLHLSASLLDLKFRAPLLGTCPSKTERVLAMSNFWFAEYIIGMFFCEYIHIYIWSLDVPAQL